MQSPSSFSSYLGRAGTVTDQGSGDGLVSSQGKAGLDGRADGAGGRSQLGLEDRVGDGRASDRGIGVGEGAERGAGSDVTVQHGGGRYSFSCVVGLASLRE